MAAYQTTIPSTNSVLAIYDNPGIYIPDFVGAGAATIGDYAYDKKLFVYFLTNSVGLANAVGRQQVGQRIIVRKINVTGNTANDWTNVVTSVSTGYTPDCSTVTTNEIRSIVSPSTNQIILDPSVSSNFP